MKIHRLVSRSHDEVLQYLGEELTATETIYLGTNLRQIYKLVVAAPIPPSPVL